MTALRPGQSPPAVRMPTRLQFDIDRSHSSCGAAACFEARNSTSSRGGPPREPRPALRYNRYSRKSGESKLSLVFLKAVRKARHQNMRIVTSCLGAWSVLGAAAIAANLAEIDVFTAGAEGYHTYRIPALIATK